jgi:hypothetical protein
MAFDRHAVAALRTRFRRDLIRLGDAGFDEARWICNGAIDRRPGLIARCAGADDVVEAVPFAREHDLNDVHDPDSLRRNANIAPSSPGANQ